MSSRALKILVADDDLAILDLYRTIFGLPDEESELNDTLNDVLSLLGEEAEETSSEYDVTLVSQGLEAVHAVREAMEKEEPFSHALLDMRMPPGIDGLETAKHLKQSDPEINITFVTAYTDYTDEQIAEVLPEGVRMLQKPFETAQIMALFE